MGNSSTYEYNKNYDDDDDDYLYLYGTASLDHLNSAIKCSQQALDSVEIQQRRTG